MKSRIITTFTAIVLAILPISLFAQDPAMYVYRTDGSVNGFVMSQVDSMSYSCIGLDSVRYDVPVVQEIWTKGGKPYRIPISSIDSIGYYTPEPIFKSGIFMIDEKNVGQVAGVDINNLTVSFIGNTPDSELPQKGQVIYCDLDEDPFPMGFSGRVKEIKSEGGNHVYVCDVAGPEEVYDRLLIAGRLDSEGNQYNSLRKATRKKGHASKGYNIGTTLFDLLTISGKGDVTLDYTLNLNVFNSQPATFWLKKQHDLDLEFKLGVKTSDMEGALTSKWDKDEKVKEYWEKPITLYTVGGIIDLDFMYGCYFSYGNEFSIEASGLKYKYTDIEEYSWTSDNPLYFERRDLYHEGGWNFDGVEDIFDKFKLKAELDGKISFGLCGEFDIAVWKPKWMSLGIELKVGPELKGSFALDTDFFKADSPETGLYKFFSEDLKLTMGVKGGFDINARYNQKEWKVFSASTTLFPMTVTLLPKLSKPALPNVYKVSANEYMLETFGAWDANLGWDSNDPFNVRTIAKNQILFPGSVGLSVYGEDGKQLFEKYGSNWHWIKTSSFATSIKDLPPQKIKVYPMFKMLGFIPIKAEPATITIPKPFTLSAESIETTQGETVDVVCNDGWGVFSLESSDDKVASLKLLEKDGKKHIQAEGLRPGTVTVNVKDVRSGDAKSFVLKVKPSAFELSTYEIKMNPNDVRTVTVFPSAEYHIKNNKSSVAKAEVISSANGDRYSCIIKITALKLGDCTITVSDATDEHSSKIDVKVTNEEIKLGVLSIEPSVIDFGDVTAEIPKTEQFTIRNTGEKSIRYRMKFESDVFEIKDEDGYNSYGRIWLEPGKSDTYAVTFTPKKIGQKYECDVIIQTDAENGNQVVKLKGQGVKPAKAFITVTPSTLDFGGVEVNSSKTMKFTVKNTGNAIMNFSVGEPSSDVFIIPGSNEDYVVNSGRENTFDVHFRPNNKYDNYKCKVTISCDAENGNQELILKGHEKDYDGYVHGICSNFTPEDGATVDASSGYVTLYVRNVTLPHDGATTFALRLNETPNIDVNKDRGYNITWNGRKGNGISNAVDYSFKVEPGKTYYWQVFYWTSGAMYYTEEDTWVACSPILTFTTLP